MEFTVKIYEECNDYASDNFYSVSQDTRNEIVRILNVERAKHWANANWKDFIPPNYFSRIPFIKEIRERFGLGLKDSKDICDATPIVLIMDTFQAGMKYQREHPTPTY